MSNHRQNTTSALKVSEDDIRTAFATAMSEMYRTEVPAYGQLMEVVAEVNAQTLGSRELIQHRQFSKQDIARLTAERHGAIRVGTAAEMSMLRRIFAVMGMFPIGYYDLSVASVPVHSTAFRPTTSKALEKNPFRVFTSLLRLDFIEDLALRERAASILNNRSIFTRGAIELTVKAEHDGCLNEADAEQFVSEVLETFRWRSDAAVDASTFQQMADSHRLIADIVAFKGPHINHLTPRTLDIDTVQRLMVAEGLPAKAIIEGPPNRACPILLRQTAFKALDEEVRFPTVDGVGQIGRHTARFGEVEQRGAALSPRGRALYDQLLQQVRSSVMPMPDGSNLTQYAATLSEVFKEFPDNWRELHDLELAYFKYTPVKGKSANPKAPLPTLLDCGAIQISPITYEDFLPVSAAGIFQSNLGDDLQHHMNSTSCKAEFESALGQPVLDEFQLYAKMQSESLELCYKQLQRYDCNSS